MSLRFWAEELNRAGCHSEILILRSSENQTRSSFEGFIFGLSGGSSVSQAQALTFILGTQTDTKQEPKVGGSF